MTDPSPFLEAILAEPEDDQPRLVYADWLEEQGDELATLIRVGCELERHAEGDPAREELSARLVSLREAGAETWLAPLRDIPHVECRWERGLAVCELGINRFLSHHSELTRCRALLGVEVECLDKNLEYLGATLWEGVQPLPRLVGLHVLDCCLSEQALHELVTSPFLPRLTGLRLFDEDFDDLVLLIKSTELPREIALEGAREMFNGARWPGMLVRALRQPGGLQELDLSGEAVFNNGGETLLEQLGQLPALASVRTLRLRNWGLRGSAVIELLTRSPYLSQLTHLDLGWLRTDESESVYHNIFPDGDTARRKPWAQFSPAARAFCARLQHVILGIDYWVYGEYVDFLRRLFPAAEVFVDDASYMNHEREQLF